MIRLPLAIPTEPRDASSDKDSLIQNAYIDQDPSGASFAVKRPGFFVGTEAITTGTNRGIFVNPNNPTGGETGETQVWYIGGTDDSPTLSNFNTNGQPPADETLVMSADFPGGLGNSYIGYTTDSSLAFGVVIQQGLNGSGGADIQFTYAVVGDTEATIMYQLTSTMSGNYKITKDSNNFYCYINDELVATSSYVFTGYTTQTTHDVSNPQFGLPEV